jgi:hypothetical protein
MNEKKLIKVDKEFCDLSFRLSKEVETKFLDIQNKMVLGELFEDDHSNGGVEWNKFTQELFQRLKLEHPSHFTTKEDLSKIIVTIGNAGKANAKELNCGGFYLAQWNFFFTMCFMGDFASTSFQNAVFHSDVSFQSSRFHDHSCFHQTTFSKTADFEFVDFHQTADFGQSHFKDFARFDTSKFFAGFDFSRSNCDKRLDLRDIIFPKGSNIKCNFRKANFYGDLVLTQNFDCNSKDYSEVSDFDISGAYFYSTFDLSVAFHSCPNFSESRLLGEKFIKETWLERKEKISDSQIKKYDVEKFRFFKNYFEKNGNHFKEREYFAYEMKAVEVRKKEAREKDLWLFEIYRIFSDYGISILKPFLWILFLGVVFSGFFLWEYPKEFTKKPDEKSLAFSSVNTSYFIEQKSGARQQEINILAETQNLLSAAEKEKSDQTSEVSFGQIAAKNFLLTINPLGSFKAVENSSNPWFIFLVGFQAIINTAFLFLLALGIRNRFKLK